MAFSFRSLGARLFRYRLRSMLLLTALVSVFLAAWSVWIRPYVGQQTALQELSRLNATITSRAATAPDWIQRLMGEDFVEVYAVTDVGAADDDSLAHVHKLIFIESLNLEGAEITDQVGIRLGTLMKMRSLNLGKTRITDETVKQLDKLTHLESLSLRYVPLTDEAAKTLASLQAMRQLRLTGTEVSDNSIDLLAQLSQLDELYIRWTLITPAGAERLQELLPKTKIYFVPRPSAS